MRKSQTISSDNESICILIQISLNSVLKGATDSKSVLNAIPAQYLYHNDLDNDIAMNR